MKTASLREDWEGRTINGRFALLEWLGGTADYGVFLTIRQGAQKAAIKVVLADGADADAYIAQWEAATALSHPHLLRVLEIGRCDIDGVGVVYIVTEHGDVALSRILADEAIGANEAIEVIESLLDVLSYLHGKGIVHGHVNPSNILFVGDEVKLAGGDFLVADGVQRQVRKPATCDAPEVVSGKITAAADMWSVGMVLAEAMTQRSPRWDWAGKGGPIVPDSLPQPFFEIVQECLRLDPARRCTIPEIRARLGNQTPQPPAKTSTPNASLQFAATKPVPQQAPVAAAAAPIAASAQPATPPAESAAPPPGPISAIPVSQYPESKPAPNPMPTPVPSEPISAPAGQITAPTAQAPAPAAPIPVPAAQPQAPVQPVSAAPAPPPISAPPNRPPERPAPPAERRAPIAEPRFGYEEPDDYLRPKTLFASAEEEPRRFRLFPTLIGVLVVFAFIAFLLERSNPAIFSSLVGTQKATVPSQTKPQTQSSPPSSTANQPEAQTTPAPAQTAPSQSPTVPSETQSAPAATQSTAAQQATAEPAPTRPAPTRPAPAETAPAPTRPPTSEPSTTGSSSAPMTGQSVPPPLTRPARASSYENSRGGVAKQVLPSVSPNARRSMRRPIEISVLVSVDRNGTVTSATYGSYGPGNYFARVAVRAAHDWTFTPPMLDGHPESSFWTLHFFFDRARTVAIARQDTR